LGALAGISDRIPASHGEALCPLILAQLRLAISTLPKLDHRVTDGYVNATKLLARHHYIAAIPALIDLLRACSTDEQFGVSPVLCRMGLEAVAPLEGLLGDPELGVRASAAQTLGAMLEPDRSPGPQPDPDRDELRRRLRSSVAPKLEGLAAADPNPWVRKSAREALGAIRR